MRKPKYLSPSSLCLWESDKEEFFFKHLATVRPPRMEQKNYMGMGSAFDAFVKAELHTALFGAGTDVEFEFDTIFCNQVEPQNRDFCMAAGQYVFDAYKSCGAYDDLLTDLQGGEFEPQFEFRADKKIDGVPLMGLPDCRYIHKTGAHVILDWKVNGFCSKHGATPYKYYSLIRDGWGGDEAKASRSNGKSHPGYSKMTHKGVEIGSHYLHETCPDWADQLCIYSWMLDEPVGGEDVIVCMEQIAAKFRKDKYPLLRIANHRCRIQEAWQNELVQRLTSCWKVVNSDHIFRDMSKEDSQERQELLEMEAKAMAIDANDGSIEAWVSGIRRENGMRFRKR